MRSPDDSITLHENLAEPGPAQRVPRRCQITTVTNRPDQHTIDLRRPRLRHCMRTESLFMKDVRNRLCFVLPRRDHLQKSLPADWRKISLRTSIRNWSRRIFCRPTRLHMLARRPERWGRIFPRGWLIHARTPGIGFCCFGGLLLLLLGTPSTRWKSVRLSSAIRRRCCSRRRSGRLIGYRRWSRNKRFFPCRLPNLISAREGNTEQKNHRKKYPEKLLIAQQYLRFALA